MHTCYLLYSETSKRIYIGYTNNFEKRILKHNGILKGGAKKTSFGRPWKPILNITGFSDNHQALRFEFRWQRLFARPKGKMFKNLPKNRVKKAVNIMSLLIAMEDGAGNDKKSWNIDSINFY